MDYEDYNERMAALGRRTAIQLVAALAIVLVITLLIGWLSS
jgi:hypothetical protein